MRGFGFLWQNQLLSDYLADGKTCMFHPGYAHQVGEPVNKVFRSIISLPGFLRKPWQVPQQDRVFSCCRAVCQIMGFVPKHIACAGKEM